MAYKKYNKSKYNGNKKTTNEAIIEILRKNKEPMTQTEIHEKIKEKPYELKLSRMGLWKVLGKLEKQKDIKKTVFDGVFVYKDSSKSKIVAEMSGIDFALHFKKMFIDKPELVKEFGLTKKTKNNPEALMRFFGFYVLSTLVISRIISKEQRSNWLAVALDLEKSVPMSTFFERFTENNDKTIKEIAITLKENYKKNFAYMSKTSLDVFYRSIKIEKALFPENKTKSH